MLYRITECLKPGQSIQDFIEEGGIDALFDMDDPNSYYKLRKRVNRYIKIAELEKPRFS